MSKGLIGAAGGGKVTVTGLTAGTVKKGTTVTVKQGAKTVANVTGTLAPLALFAYGHANGDSWGAWFNVTGTTFVSPNNILVGTNGKPTITVKETGKYRFYVAYSAYFGDGTDVSNSFQLLRNGAAIVSKSSLGDNGVIYVDVQLTAGDVLTWQIYVHHAAVVYYNFITAYRIA